MCGRRAEGAKALRGATGVSVVLLPVNTNLLILGVIKWASGGAVESQGSFFPFSLS